MKTIFKWSSLIIVILVLISLYYFVQDKESQGRVSGDELRVKARAEMSHGHYPRAIALLKKALAKEPNNMDIRVAMGHAYLESGNVDSAEVYLASAIDADKNNTDAVRYMVNVNMQQYDTLEALQNIDRYLLHYPADEQFLLKKYVLLLQHGDYGKADRAYSAYTSKFNAAPVRSVRFDHWQDKATRQRKNGVMADAYESYRKASSYEPKDKDALQQLVNLSVQNGDYTAAANYNNSLLAQDSKNATYLANASHIHTKLNNRDMALAYAGKAYELYPANEKAKNQYVDIHMAYAKNETPLNKIRYAETVLQAAPSQKYALLYVINGYIDMHRYAEALYMTDVALEYYPRDQLFIDKKTGIFYETKDFVGGAAYMETVLTNSPSAHNVEYYSDLQLQIAKSHLNTGHNDAALAAIDKGLAYDKSNIDLLEQQLSIYITQGKTNDITITIDQLTKLAPDNPAYQFKKSGLLEAQGKYEEAASISHALAYKYPYVSAYSKAYTDQMTRAQKAQLGQRNWDKAIALYSKMAQTGQPEYDAMLYATAAYTEKANYERVLSMTQTALARYPDDSLFLVKKAVAYSLLKRYPESIAATEYLLDAYPEDKMLQNMYLDILLSAGMDYKRQNKSSPSRDVFFTASEFAPDDTFAFQRLSEYYFERKQYDSSIYYANKGLLADSSNNFLAMKKIASYEQMQDYTSAHLSANKLLQTNSSKTLAEYSRFLQNKSYKNQVGVSMLRSFFSSSALYASVVGLQYTRSFNKTLVTARLNVGQRPVGTALQGGLDVYYSHNMNYYSNAQVYVSQGTVFPYLQGSYSLFRNFNEGWELELGGRYLGFATLKNYVGVASVGKYIGSTWINLRGYYTYDTENWHPSYLLTMRQYLNDKNDYVSVIGGAGRQPDDVSLAYNFEGLRSYNSKTVGIGFQKSLGYRTIINTSFNYTNLKPSSGQTLNQYDFFVRLLRNF